MNLIDIKSTLKHLQKNKFHSLLNIFGLAVGVLFFFQLIVYISYEKGYDSSYDGADRVYRVNYDVEQNGQNVLHSAKTPDRLYRVLKDEIPEVEYSAVGYLENVLVRSGDKFYVDQPTLWVGGDFAEVFDLKMVSGVSKIRDKLTCVISESMAKRLRKRESHRKSSAHQRRDATRGDRRFQGHSVELAHALQLFPAVGNICSLRMVDRRRQLERRRLVDLPKG